MMSKGPHIAFLQTLVPAGVFLLHDRTRRHGPGGRR